MNYTTYEHIDLLYKKIQELEERIELLEKPKTSHIDPRQQYVSPSSDWNRYTFPLM